MNEPVRFSAYLGYLYPCCRNGHRDVRPGHPGPFECVFYGVTLPTG